MLANGLRADFVEKKFAERMNTVTNLRRSYTVRTTETIFLFVTGRSLTTIANPHVSDDTLHHTLSPLSIGVLSNPLTELSQSLNSSKASISFLELDSHLVNLKHPSAHKLIILTLYSVSYFVERELHGT